MPVLVENIGPATLYCGDWRDCIGEIGESDHGIMDPPYGSFMHAARARSSGRRPDGTAISAPLDFATIEGQRDEVAAAWVPLIAKWMLVFCEPEAVGDWRWALMDAGARYKRACVWCKTNPPPQMNGQNPGYGVECFPAAWCGPGHSRWNGRGRHNRFTHPVARVRGRQRHKTEKPLSLMEEIVLLFTAPGDRIADPFMGAGTTGIAALKHGRRFVGVEMQRKWFEVACRRVEAALEDLGAAA